MPQHDVFMEQDINFSPARAAVRPGDRETGANLGETDEGGRKRRGQVSQGDKEKRMVLVAERRGEKRGRRL